MTRQSDTLEARRAADDFAAERSLPPAGGYTGPWYVTGYLGGWWPDWATWWADYNGRPGSVIEGSTVGHQWTSTPVDQSVFLESEIVGGNQEPVTDPEREAMQAKIDGLVNSLGYVSYDLLAPVASQKSGTKAVQRLVAGIRAQAEQQGIQHA